MSEDRMQKEKFSVLMSLYIKEKAAYFEQCMESMLNQTIFPDEIVIVLDGPISQEVKNVLEYYKKMYSDWIKIVPNKVNKGLGLALADGIPQCSYELIARMDTDDIARKDRFERQLEEFKKDAELDICGSHIIEFEGEIDNKISVRKVPITHDEIVEYQKQRSAFNHMTVMYKKSAVLKAGNYQDAPLMEDDLMWVNMILAGAKCRNIDDYLVYARTGTEMIRRRGGYAYFQKYRRGRKKILSTGYITRMDYCKTIVIQAIVALLPPAIRLFVFTKFLRKTKEC